MAPNATLKTLSFNPFIVNESTGDNNQDPELNYFHKKIHILFLKKMILALIVK